MSIIVHACECIVNMIVKEKWYQHRISLSSPFSFFLEQVVVVYMIEMSYKPDWMTLLWTPIDGLLIAEEMIVYINATDFLKHRPEFELPA